MAQYLFCKFSISYQIIVPTSVYVSTIECNLNRLLNGAAIKSSNVIQRL